MQDLDPSRDLGKIRTIELGNNKIHLKQKDPYGFWHVNFDKGQVPNKLKGAYTDFVMAERDVRAYLAEKGREPLEK
jgi:hypothetical protein